MQHSPPYAAYQIAKHKSVNAQRTANDAVEHCAWRHGRRPVSARMRMDLSEEVGDLSVPVIVDGDVPARSVYFELPAADRAAR